MEPDEHAKHRAQPCCARPCCAEPARGRAAKWGERWRAATGWGPRDGGVRGLVTKVDNWNSMRTASGHDVLVVAGRAADRSETREVVVLSVRKSRRRGLLAAVWFEAYVTAVSRPLAFFAATYFWALMTTLLAFAVVTSPGAWIYWLLMAAPAWMLAHHVAVILLIWFRAAWTLAWRPWKSVSIGRRLRWTDGQSQIDDPDSKLEALCRALDAPDGAPRVQELLKGLDKDVVGRRARNRLLPAFVGSMTAIVSLALAVVGALRDWLPGLTLPSSALGLLVFLALFSCAFVILTIPCLLSLRFVRLRDRWNDPAFAGEPAADSEPESEAASGDAPAAECRPNPRTWLGRILLRR